MSVEDNKKQEKELETHRKRTSPNRGSTQNPNSNSGREEQRRTSVGEGQLNLGSNRNAGRRSEQEDAPDSAVVNHPHSECESGAVPSQAAFEGKGEAAERSVQASKATAGRHVTSGKDGRAVSDERARSVLARRKETEKLFDSHRKKHSSV